MASGLGAEPPRGLPRRAQEQGAQAGRLGFGGSLTHHGVWTGPLRCPLCCWNQGPVLCVPWKESVQESLPCYAAAVGTAALLLTPTGTEGSIFLQHRGLSGAESVTPSPGSLLCLAAPTRPWRAHTQGARQALHQSSAGRLEGRPAHLSTLRSRELSEQGRAHVSVCHGSAHECWATSLLGGPSTEVHFPPSAHLDWGTPQASHSTHSLQPRNAESWQMPWGLWGPSGRPPPAPRPGLSWGSCPWGAGIDTAFQWLDQGVGWMSTWPRSFPAGSCLSQLHITPSSPF